MSGELLPFQIIMVCGEDPCLTSRNRRPEVRVRGREQLHKETWIPLRAFWSSRKSLVKYHHYEELCSQCPECLLQQKVDPQTENSSMSLDSQLLVSSSLAGIPQLDAGKLPLDSCPVCSWRLCRSFPTMRRWNSTDPETCDEGDSVVSHCQGNCHPPDQQQRPRDVLLAKIAGVLRNRSVEWLVNG